MKRPLSGKAKRVKSIRKFSKEIKQHMQINETDQKLVDLNLSNVHNKLVFRRVNGDINSGVIESANNHKLKQENLNSENKETKRKKCIYQFLFPESKPLIVYDFNLKSPKKPSSLSKENIVKISFKKYLNQHIRCGN